MSATHPDQNVIDRAGVSVWTIVVAGGSGNRFGGPKQYVEIGDKRVLDHSISAARAVSDGIVLVVPVAEVNRDEPTVDVVVAGGASRAASVRAGLSVVPAECPIVVIHDAARPAAPVSLFEAAIAAVCAGADGAVPGVAVTDSIRHRQRGAVDRDDYVVVQTPQAFRADALRAAHHSRAEASDDATLVEAAGGTIAVVPGSTANRKLTHAEDVALLAAAIAAAQQVDLA